MIIVLCCMLGRVQKEKPLLLRNGDGQMEIIGRDAE